MGNTHVPDVMYGDDEKLLMVNDSKALHQLWGVLHLSW